jgi:hypothetical protein
VRAAGGAGVNIEPLLDAFGLQEDAARALAEELRTRITHVKGRLQQAQTHLEHLALTRRTVTALTDRIPAQNASLDLPDHPDHPRILSVCNETDNPLRAGDIREALDHELLS